MILVLSPAKSLDNTPADPEIYSQPALKSAANVLAKIMKTKTPADLKQLMKISDKLAIENHKRYQDYKTRVTTKSAKRAIDTFSGDVYRGLSAESFTNKDYDYAQEHLRILSGLYGILRPLDLIQPYRLEMGTHLRTDQGGNLYEYWDDAITMELNKQIKKTKSATLLNLASNEYFKAIKPSQLEADVVVANFKEWRDDQLKFISFSAKVARGLMAKYVIQERINNVEDIKGFDLDGYSYSPDHSSDKEWIFVR